MVKTASEILAVLQGEDGTLLEKLCEVVVDGILASPVGELVDAELVLTALDAALDQRVTSWAVERHLKPAAAREHLRAQDSGEPVEAFLPGDRVDNLIAVIRRPFPVDPRIVEDLVQQKAVRSMLGAIVQEAIQGFVSRAPIPGLAAAVKVMGNLSKRLDQHVGDFLDRSMVRLTSRLAELALSESGQKLIGEMGAEMARIALKTPVSFYYGEMAKLPTEELWALVPPVLAHNLARPEIREALSGEVAALLQHEGDKRARELLQELGILESVRELAVGQAVRVARRIIGQPAFQSWLEAMVEQA